MFEFAKQSQGLLLMVATALGFLGLASSDSSSKNQKAAPQVLSAEADHPLVENARPLYDGRGVRVEAQVIRQPVQQSGCGCTSPNLTNVSRPANPAPKGILDDFAGKILSEVSHAQAQGVANVRVFRVRMRERSGPIFPNRPRFRR